MVPDPILPYRLAVLVFVRNGAGEHLLLRRARPPNRGQWSPIGGKLETGQGESPHACARRETAEETGLVVAADQLRLFALIAERAYEGSAHWLMFLFDCLQPIAACPPPGPEGDFAFFPRAAIDRLDIPDTDRVALWPTYDRHRHGFVALRADCRPGQALQVEVEQWTGPTADPLRPGLNPAEA